jgi:Uma2 family endonuclease
MSSALKTKLTVAEYLAMERASETKHEYFGGDDFAVAGGTPEHSLIASNFIREAGNALKERPCFDYTSDLRVKVKPSGLYTYPDVTIVCGQQEFDDNQGDALVNPTVLVEVLSKSTAAYDRGTKSKHYRKIESLRALLLIEQDSPTVDVIWLQPDGNWVLSDATELSDSIAIEPLGISIPLAEIYRNVTFPDRPPSSETGLFTIE